MASNGCAIVTSAEYNKWQALITVPAAHYPNVKHSQLGNYRADPLHLKTAS